MDFDFHFEFLGFPKHIPVVTGSAPTSPTTGMRVWYDASDDATITHASNAVSQWNDKSGNALHMVNTGAGNVTRTPNYKNNMQYLVCPDETVARHLTVANSPTYTGATVTIYTVTVPQTSTGTGNRRIFSMSDPGTADATAASHLNIGKNSSNTQYNIRKGAATGAGQFTIVNDTPYVYVAQRTSVPDLRAWLNDISSAASIVADVTNFNVSQFRIFNTALSPGTTSMFVGGIGELIVYYAEHDTTTISNNMQYLRNKWGF